MQWEEEEEEEQYQMEHVKDSGEEVMEDEVERNKLGDAIDSVRDSDLNPNGETDLDVNANSDANAELNKAARPSVQVSTKKKRISRVSAMSTGMDPGAVYRSYFQFKYCVSVVYLGS